jgi:XTP/dITP diphosphohydrolase
MPLLFIATRNRHKVQEIRFFLGRHCRFLSLADFADSPNIVEDGATFEDNARIKAEAVARWLAAQPAEVWERKLGCPPGGTERCLVMADDSGLEVDALNGAPGVHSARFAALDTGRPGNSEDKDNNEKLLRLLAEVPPAQRAARFRCVIALTPVQLGSDKFTTATCSGACEGKIGIEAQGRAGFGYDPLFYPRDYFGSFATLGREIKNRISHRAAALRKARQQLFRLKFFPHRTEEEVTPRRVGGRPFKRPGGPRPTTNPRRRKP